MFPRVLQARRRGRHLKPLGSRIRSWRLSTPAPEALRIDFLRSVVTYDELRPLFDWLVSEGSANWRVIAFDFTKVRDIAAPWAPVFAHLEYMASRTGVRCQLAGLNARLSNMATFATERTVAGELEIVAEAAEEVCEVGKC